MPNLSVRKFASVAAGTLLLLSAVTPAFAASPRTYSTWTTSNAGGVTVIPYVRVDKKGMFVDFEAANFKNIDSIYYNLNIDTDEPESLRGVEGTFWPRGIAISGYYKNKPYYRRELTFGTCSRDTCTYYRNPHNLKLTVTTKFLTGKLKEHTQVITIPDAQLK